MTARARVEAPEAGIAMAFPADRDVPVPMASRESDIRTGPDAEPVHVTTVFYWEAIAESVELMPAIVEGPAA